MVADPLGLPCYLDNVFVYLISHIHHCCGIYDREALAGIIGVHLAVPVLLFFNVGGLCWSLCVG